MTGTGFRMIRASRHYRQAELFEDPSGLPEGLRYRPEFIDRAEERRLVRAMERLEFAPFEFHGFAGKRRVVSFGWRYDFNRGGLQRTEDMPGFLTPIREAAAAFAGLPSSKLQQVLLTEYAPGAAIGWHKDRSVFGDVVGISLLSACTLRFRRKADGGWERLSLIAEARSAYLLRGPSRAEWQHSIPPVDDLRYSVTFRSFREP
jgi:alkylated DNA repair dioxygenase AlkB